MAAVVNLGGVQIGSGSNGVGVFSGQNMQNSWDANSPNTSNVGTLMGQFSVQLTYFTLFNNFMPIGQPVQDSDFKSNAAPMVEGP